MTSIIDFGEAALQQGKRMFAQCGCGSEDGFAVVVVNPAVISCLVCTSCSKEIPVFYGVLEEVEG